MTVGRKWMMVVAVVLISVAADQATKWIAQETLHPDRLEAGSKLFWPKEGPIKDVFRLQYARNPGAFLSLFAGLPDSIRVVVLLGINGVILGLLLVFLTLKSDLRPSAVGALALVLSGGIGNLLDRIFREGHEVVDFMNLGIGSLRTGVFNIADLAIVGGVVALLAIEVFFGPSPSHETAPPLENNAA